uniref:Small ribosomal subunit biogenesis GTPase RsgA n=1 Tax=Aquifex aeolicus TaxID=63363 RepID=A4PIH2_AQUAO|nr:Chain A, YjeQ protein [Aquifex aeolicus]BAF50733.2 YjeQ protein [Aquifex aeolicus]
MGKKELKRGLVVDREAQMIGVYLFEDGKTYRGIPRGKVLKKTKIYAGDYVWGEVVDPNTFAIEEVEERKNLLIRPKVANVDRVIIVETLKMPEFNNYLLDNMLVVYEYFKVEPVIVFNKIDLLNEEEKKELERWISIYRDAGYDVLKVSAKTGEGIDELVDYLEGFICILAGPSGVGKSSILSRLTGEELRTQEVSEKTERGRHTTTGVRLIPFGKGSFVGDTPGFSKVEATMFVKPREVRNYFREFLRYQCKYPDCTHTNEPGCAVKEAVKNGEISCERYKSYLKIIKVYLEEIKELCRED